MKRPTKEDIKLEKAVKMFVKFYKEAGLDADDDDDDGESTERGSSPEITRPHLESELEIGMLVIAKSGRSSQTKWSRCKIVDTGILQVSGDKIYRLERVEGGRRLGFKYASELFPINMPVVSD
jgi:hypothetical protein